MRTPLREVCRTVCYVRSLPLHHIETIIAGRTDLPPLALAVVVLEEALVVRDTVLAEHEPIDEKTGLARVIN
jgi:hypothetical protein